MPSPSVDLFGITPAHLVEGVLVFVRTLAVFTSAPVFGHQHLPVQVKICLAAMIALILIPIVPAADPSLISNIFLLGAAAVREAAVGLIIGFIATLAFTAIQLAGETADIQVGFGLANIADPLLGFHTSLIGQFQYLVSVLFFLAIDGHHVILTALVRSFTLVPLDSFSIHAGLTAQTLAILGELFVIGMRIAAPVMLAVMLTDLGLGLVSRAVPQMIA